MKKLIIAEKPSVAKNIAEALNIKSRSDGYLEGDSYIVTWVFGHLLQLYDVVDYDEKLKGWRLENFPFIPSEFQYKIKSKNNERGVIDAGAQKQVNIIKNLVQRSDVDSVISATDYDREGQVIADEIFLYLSIQKPIFRLLLNEWTPDEVLKGLDCVCLNSEMKSMQDAGFGRQVADWLIGINLTSVATVKCKNSNNSKVLNIGRVLLPTLKIIYDRDKEIESFESSKYYKLISFNKTEKGEIIEATYAEDDNEKFEEIGILQVIESEIKGKSVIVFDKQIERKKEYPPYLFNLSNLQGYITSKYKGWTSDKVLKVAQELYEKKLITYPRTASSVLDESLTEKVNKVLNLLKKGLPYESEIQFSTSKRIFDSSKVESHSAIIPTYIMPGKITPDEDAVYQAIKNRFIMQFLPIAESEETKLSMRVLESSIKGEFVSKGKVQIAEGWKVVEKITTKETILPLIEQDEKLEITKSEIGEVVRKPPKAHSEKTLLRVMETCGKSFEDDQSEEMMMSILTGFSIGTPATRAETIKKLRDVGYIESKGKNLVCTELGIMLVETFPVKELFDLEYTGRLEKTLSDIERKKFNKQDFLDLIVEFTKKSVTDIKNDIIFGSNVVLPNTVEIIGKCPECGNPIIETEKAFGCSNWKNGCKFTIWKNDKFIESFGKKINADVVRILLEKGRVGFRGLLSKKGNKFSAYFKYIKDTEKGNYSWSMEFIDENKSN